MADYSFEKAKSYAYRLIDYSPRSEKEFRDRLRKKGCSEDVIERIASDLKKEGLLGDKNFAKLWMKMRSQGAAGRGLSLIKMELICKGVDRDLVCETADKLKDGLDEEDTARQLLRRRRRSIEGMDRQKARARLYGYLRRRGFSSEVIWKVLDEAYRA